MTIMTMDVSCAFLYAAVARDLYIELPAGDPEGGAGRVGHLRKALYGTRDAPSAVAEDPSERRLQGERVAA